MKKLTQLFLFCLSFSSMIAQNKTNGMQNIGETQGDLDKDNIDEKVIVYNTTRQTDIGTEREIHIFKKQNNEWKLWHKSIGAVMSSEAGGIMGDPFQEVKVENGSLVIRHSGGSREKWAYTHRFRFQNNTWELIGATNMSGTPCETWETYDYNFSTGKITYTKEKDDCDEKKKSTPPKPISQVYSIKLAKLPQMDGFKTGETEVKIPNSKKSFYY